MTRWNRHCEAALAAEAILQYPDIVIASKAKQSRHYPRLELLPFLWENKKNEGTYRLKDLLKNE
jgi:hypothetical protein